MTQADSDQAKRWATIIAILAAGIGTPSVGALGIWAIQRTISAPTEDLKEIRNDFREFRTSDTEIREAIASLETSADSIADSVKSMTSQVDTFIDLVVSQSGRIENIDTRMRGAERDIRENANDIRDLRNTVHRWNESQPGGNP